MVDDELAVTLLRATGKLSRNIHPYRSDPAGPELDTPQAQIPGVLTTRLALLPHAGEWHEAGVLDAAEQWRHEVHAVVGLGAADLPLRQASGLTVTGTGATMSSLRRRGDWLELRLVAEHPEPVTATLVGRFTDARRSNLLGNPGDPLATATVS